MTTPTGKATTANVHTYTVDRQLVEITTDDDCLDVLTIKDESEQIVAWVNGSELAHIIADALNHQER